MRNSTISQKTLASLARLFAIYEKIIHTTNTRTFEIGMERLGTQKELSLIRLLQWATTKIDDSLHAAPVSSDRSDCCQYVLYGTTLRRVYYYFNDLKNHEHRRQRLINAQQINAQFIFLFFFNQQHRILLFSQERISASCSSML